MGNKIYMFASGVQNQVGSVDLSFVEKTGSTWSNPKSMGNPPNLAQDQYHPCIVSDTSVYFATSNGEITMINDDQEKLSIGGKLKINQGNAQHFAYPVLAKWNLSKYYL